MGTWLPRTAGLPRAYWALWLGTLVNRIGTFVVPFLAVYLTEKRHLSVERAGLILALFGAGSLASAPVGGALADRIGRKRTLVLSMLLGAAAMVHLGFARAPLHVAAAALLLGFLGDMYRPASQALVADLVKPEDRTRAYALQYWAVNLGFAFGTTIAGLLAATNFTLLFLGDAAATVLCALIVALNVPSPARGKEHDRPARLDYLAPYRDAPFLAFVVLSFLAAVIFQQWISTMPIHMRAQGIAPSVFGMLFSINGILIVLIQPWIVGPIQKLRRERVLALGALLTGIGFGMNAIATTPAQYAAAICVWTMGEIATVPILSTVVAAVAPKELRGSYQGAFSMSFSGATLAAPALGSFVYAALGADALWGACFGAGVLVAVGYLALGRPLGRRIAAAQPT